MANSWLPPDNEVITLTLFGMTFSGRVSSVEMVNDRAHMMDVTTFGGDVQYIPGLPRRRVRFEMDILDIVDGAKDTKEIVDKIASGITRMIDLE